MKSLMLPVALTLVLFGTGPALATTEVLGVDVSGPGLRPDVIVLPCRYFTVKLKGNSRYAENENLRYDMFFRRRI